MLGLNDFEKYLIVIILNLFEDHYSHVLCKTYSNYYCVIFERLYTKQRHFLKSVEYDV